ncbi:hypothetical protein IQ235_02305 [Oscillatoriales cyanobacterium LEGE 11467]|uniref:Uncharacterized protein n=1 Tax=Zarconia navalis LEGE 11467 TaxID=1828826 RepID=A0A928VSU2_9CYAN|nr:hypothetical protein [Zarconia navalis]MBE9039627.1 hypothetical protein [Zarconia navalis LEGE 11467]
MSERSHHHRELFGIAPSSVTLNSGSVRTWVRPRSVKIIGVEYSNLDRGGDPAGRVFQSLRTSMPDRDPIGYATFANLHFRRSMWGEIDRLHSSCPLLSNTVRRPHTLGL